jgi:DNA-directed RNA polymerase subunit K/omega
MSEQSSDTQSSINSDILETEDVTNSINNEIDITSILTSDDTQINKEIYSYNKNPEKRISKNKLTKYEFVRIIGERKTQLTAGAKPLIKVNPKSENLTYEEIAIEELKMNMLPLIIKRPVNEHYEIWKLSELDKSHLEHLFI